MIGPSTTAKIVSQSRTSTPRSGCATAPAACASSIRGRLPSRAAQPKAAPHTGATVWLRFDRPKRAATALNPIFPKESWRRRPDLNRGWRFCRPLPYHLATAPIEDRGLPAGNRRPRQHDAHLGSRELGWASRRSASVGARAKAEWSGKRDSNPRLRPWQGRTLPLSYSRSRAKS
jgi:hypothetical protein